MITRNHRIPCVVFFALLLAQLVIPAPTAHAQALPITQQPPQESHRILVKLRTSLAGQIEAELPAQGALSAMTIPAGAARNAALQSFLKRYSPGRLTPVYPAMIRERQQHGWSDAQIADLTRQRFPNRAAGQINPLGVPEISRTYVLDFPGANSTRISALTQQLRTDPDVEFAEPDHIVHTTQLPLPNDPFLASSGTWGQPYQDLWGHYAINAPTAWNTALGDGIIVAVVDTGIDYNHPDIAANVIVKPGSDFIGSNCFSPTTGNDPIDHFGHGTHVAGTIAAVGNNGIGIIGIAWHAQVLAVKGLDDGGCGLDSTLAPAIQFAANNGAHVINASWGGNGTSQTIEQAIQFATGLGVVFVAAAGNSSEDAVEFFPANSPEAITVAAFEFPGFPAFFTNIGTKIDVTAPGVDILSLRAAGSNIGQLVGTDYMRLDGTSMAAPHVSGSTALILSQHPTYTTEDVRQTLRASATNSNGWDPMSGYGTLNASGALALASVLQAHIASPVGGSQVNSLVTLSGVAQGPGFDHYVLDFGAGSNPSTFTVLQTGTSPVNGGALGTFDPAQVPDGVYTIRLTAFDSANHAFADRMVLVVNYLTITSPQPPASPSQALEFKPGAQLQITGTATGGSFKDFRVLWAEGIKPTTGFGPTGITLAGGGASPVSGGTLATWDTSTITNADYYTIRLLVDDAGFTSMTDTLIYLEPSLVSQNWPKVLNQVPDSGTGVAPFLDASGNNQLALVTPVFLFDPIAGQYLTFSPDGSSQNEIGVNTPSYFFAAAATLDQNPGQEVVVAEENDIRIFHPDNTSTTIPLPAAFSNYFMTEDQVVLAPLEGTPQLDILDMAESFDAQGNPLARALFAWRPDGSLINSNFPITVPNLDLNTIFPVGPRFVVGDLNGDGKSEIIVVEGTATNSFTLGLFAQDGTSLSWSVPVMDGYTGPIVLADLDHNGKLETLMVQEIGNEIGGSFTSGLLHVFQPDGSERPGWPVAINAVGRGDGSMAVGDLNGDGREEIIVDAGSTLYVLNTDGTSFSSNWPFVLQPCTETCPSQIHGPIILADVDGGGLPEIVVPQWNFPPNPLFPGLLDSSANASQAALQAELQAQRAAIPSRRGSMAAKPSATIINPPGRYNQITLTALRRDATLAKSWTVQGTIGQEPGIFSVSAAAGDFLQNGTTDIALNYRINVPGVFSLSGPVPGMVTVLSTGAPVNPKANDWPLVNQNARNTATQRRSITLSLTAPSAGTSVSSIIPVTAATTGTIASLQFMLDGANLGTAFTAPPFTIQWDTGQSAQGPHQLTALATDGNGIPVASAVVNVTVIRGTSSTVSLSRTAGGSPSTFGDSITFTATVSPGSATGTIAFFDGSQPISGKIPLNNASASLTTTVLVSGSHTITAEYSGDNNVSTSTSAGMSQNVGPATLTISANDATKPFGAFNPFFTGNVSGAVNGDTFVESFSTNASQVSPIGNYTITPTVTGSDLANYTVSATNGTLSVTPAPLTITANNATRVYGTPNPAFSGSITGAVNGDLFTESFSTAATITSPGGVYAIVPAVTGSEISNYSVSPVNGTLTVSPAASKNAVASSNTSVNVNSSVTFTATVTSTAPGNPSGTVQFLDGAAVLQTSPLNGQGVATFTTTNLAGGTHTITAQYNGDSSFAGSSATVTENIMDFSATAASTSATIKDGGSATFTFTVTPLGGFNQAVSFSCSGLPAQSQCSFNPSSVTPNGSSVMTAMTITTTGPSAALVRAPYRRNSLPLYASLSGGVLGLAWMAAGGRRRRKTRLAVLLASVTLLMICGLVSCGGGGGTTPGNPGTPLGTSQITVTTSAGGTSHTSQVTITVTN